MQRKFLEELGLDKEVIDKVMQEHGKTVEKHKKDLESASEKSKNLETELETANKTLGEATSQIEQFKSMDIEGIKKSAEEWKGKYDTFQKEAETQKAEFAKQIEAKEYAHAAKEFVGGHKFSSEFAKGAFMKEFLAKELKLENGKFLGADDYINQFKESNAGVFIEDQAQNQNQNQQQQQSTYQYQPQGGGNTNQDIAAQFASAIAGTL